MDKELKRIKYDFIVNVTRILVAEYYNGDYINFDFLISNVKSFAAFIKKMDYTFDETIWPPERPETYNRLVEFRVQLYGEGGCLPFRLFINKGVEQSILFPPFVWED